ITTTRALRIDVEYYPSSSQQVYSPDVLNWRVAATITGANPSLGTSAVSTYTTVTDGSLTMVRGDGSINVEIPCSGTNPSTGLTCSSGTEDVGVAFTIPRAGSVVACASFSHQLYLSATGSQAGATFVIAETTNTSQTT